MSTHYWLVYNSWTISVTCLDIFLWINWVTFSEFHQELRTINPFITPILKSLVFPVIWLALIGAIYSWIAPFFALNYIFFPASEEAALKTKQPITFQGFFKVTNQTVRKWKTESIMWQFLQLLFLKLKFPPPHPPKMDEFNFKPVQYCINKIFELTKSCNWVISKWM